MRILGLTGSIGMGKSTAASMLRRLGIPVHDADATVHALLGPGGAALSAVEAAFPGVVGAKGVDRQQLGRRVFAQPEQLRRLEAIVHPLVRRAEWLFLQQCRRRKVPLVVLDIPLLFETKGERRCDQVAVVWCSQTIQQQRVLRRPGMSLEKYRAIRAQQMPVAQKRRRADWLIPSGLGRAATMRCLRRWIAAAALPTCSSGR